MNSLQTKVRLLEAEILADKIRLTQQGLLLKKKLKHIQLTCIASPLIVGGFMLGYSLFPSKSAPKEYLSLEGGYFTTIKNWLKKSHELVGPFWLSFLLQTFTKSWRYNS